MHMTDLYGLETIPLRATRDVCQTGCSTVAVVAVMLLATEECVCGKCLGVPQGMMQAKQQEHLSIRYWGITNLPYDIERSNFTRLKPGLMRRSRPSLHLRSSD
jgi:hypothetical protein